VRELQKVRAKDGHESRGERTPKLEEIIEKVYSEALLATVLVLDPFDEPWKHLKIGESFGFRVQGLLPGARMSQKA
jgi:hypothetical protein